MPAVELLGLRQWKSPCTRHLGRVEAMAPPPYRLLKGRRAAVDLFPYTNRTRGNGKIRWICSYGTMWIYSHEQAEPLTSKSTYRAT